MFIKAGGGLGIEGETGEPRQGCSGSLEWLAWEELLQTPAHLVASLVGTLRVQEVLTCRAKKGVSSWEGEHRVHWVLCLEGLYLFSKGRNIMEVSGDDLNRISSPFQVCPLIC